MTLPDETRWITDVCFSGDGPTRPMRLQDGFTIQNMGTQQVWLVRDFIPAQVFRDNNKLKMWQYQYRNAFDHPWIAFHVFSDSTEWTSADFDVIHYFECENPDSISWKNVVVVIRAYQNCQRLHV